MSDEQRMVTEFHRAFTIAIGTSPAMPDEATCALRIRLIQQELEELQEACAQQDVAAVAKELADLLYVVYGTAVSCGVEMAPVFWEVHRSNMSKVGVRQRPDGTWIKPAGYFLPRIHPILAAQDNLEHHEVAMPPQHQNGEVRVLSATLQGETSDPAFMSTSQDEPATVASQDGLSHVRPEQLRPPSEDGRSARHTRDDTRMRESLTVQCPRCGKSFVRRSHRKRLKERLLSLAYIYPFRCQVCGNRFKAFQFRAHYMKRSVDRRQYTRLLTQIPITFAEAVKPGEHRMGEGMVTDIALGGCYLQTVMVLSEGTLLSLELQTEPDTPAIAVEAAIVRIVRPTGVGLEFLRLSEPEQERLSEFIHQLLPEQLPAEVETESS